MSCLNLNDYNKGCDNSVGGISKVVIFEFSGVTDYTVSAENELTELTLGAAFDAYSVDFMKDNSNVTDAIVGDGITANASWQPTVNMVFKKNSKEILKLVKEFSKNYLVAIIKDNNGNYFTLGIQRGLSLIASGGSSTGNTLTDPNNVTIALQGAEPNPMYETDISAGSGVDAKILAKFGF